MGRVTWGILAYVGSGHAIMKGGWDQGHAPIRQYEPTVSLIDSVSGATINLDPRISCLRFSFFAPPPNSPLMNTSPHVIRMPAIKALRSHKAGHQLPLGEQNQMLGTIDGRLVHHERLEDVFGQHKFEIHGAPGTGAPEELVKRVVDWYRALGV